jgi:hypothetical protein
MIYLDFLLNFSKIEIIFLLVYGGIVVKLDNSYLFEMILIFLFHAWAKMDNEIYLHVCVDVVMHFVMNLIIMIQHKIYICLQTIQFFHLCAFNT